MVLFHVVSMEKPKLPKFCASGARVGAHLFGVVTYVPPADAAAKPARNEEVEGVWPGAAVTSLPVAMTD